MPAIDDAMITRFYRDVGGRVRSARMAANLTQDGLAAQVEMTRSSIANLEAGRQRIPLHTFVLIAEVLKVAPTELLPTRSIADLVDDFFNVDQQLSEVAEDSRDFITGAIAQLRSGSEGEGDHEQGR